MDKLKHDRRFEEKRRTMVERQLKSRGISNPQVLAAFYRVPREIFVPAGLENKAYEDHPLPIGHDQTISQPYVVALMTESLEPLSSDRVLEIGAGSGYQTAILAELVAQVYSIEIVEELFKIAKMRLVHLGYQNVHLKHDDGRNGWSEEAPFDKIIVTAGATEIPSALVAQLKEDGRVVIPIGYGDQDLILGRKEKGVLITKQLIPVRFVPIQTELS